jgi:hypothetical protein
MGFANARLSALCTKVLKDEARQGQTTLSAATAKVVTIITRKGYRSFGISDADILMALKYVVAGELRNQLKAGLPENVFGQVLPNAPPILVQLMHKLPSWIAVEEGVHARWVPTLKASPEQWEATAMLKLKKAEQTMNAVNTPQSVARYLSEFGFESLQALLRTI